MLTLNQFLALNLGKAKVTKTNNEITNVEIVDYDLDKYLEFIVYDKRVPKGFEFIKELIILKPVRIYGYKGDIGDKIIIIPFFKIPINVYVNEEKYKGEEFRIYPVDPMILVGNKGTFIKLENGKYLLKKKRLLELIAVVKELNINKTITVNGKELKVSKVDESKTYYPTLHYGEGILTSKAHRIVALSWLDDPNFNLVENFTVDHKNNDKTNYLKDNLDFVSFKRNKQEDNYLTIGNNDIKYVLKRLRDNKNISLRDLEDLKNYLKLTDKEIEQIKQSKKLPIPIKKYNETFVLMNADEYTNMSDEFLLDRTEYRYRVVSLKNNSIFLFKSLEEILKKFKLSEYKLTKNYKEDLFENLKKKLKELGYELVFIGKTKVYNQHSKDKYHIEAKNLKTEEIVSAPSTKKLAEKINISKSTIINRLNGNQLEGVPAIDKEGNEWLIRRSDMEFPKIKEPKAGKRVPVEVIAINGKLHFKSLREAAKELNISRTNINRMAKLKDNKYIVDLTQEAAY